MKNNDTFDDVTDVEPTEQNLMVVPEGANALINYEDKAREVEARVDLLNKIIPTLVKLCSQGDITDYGGKPFFGDNACQKIARVMAISFSQPKVEEERDQSPPREPRDEPPMSVSFHWYTSPPMSNVPYGPGDAENAPTGVK